MELKDLSPLQQSDIITFEKNWNKKYSKRNQIYFSHLEGYNKLEIYFYSNKKGKKVKWYLHNIQSRNADFKKWGIKYSNREIWINPKKEKRRERERLFQEFLKNKGE